MTKEESDALVKKLAEEAIDFMKRLGLSRQDAVDLAYYRWAFGEQMREEERVQARLVEARRHATERYHDLQYRKFRSEVLTRSSAKFTETSRPRPVLKTSLGDLIDAKRKR